MAIIPPPRNCAKKSSGTAAEIAPATTSPASIALPISPGRVTKPCSNALTIFGFCFFSSQQASLHSGWDAPSGCGSNSWTRPPPIRPVISAAKGLKIAYTGPNKLNVTRILSTPVWGVDSRKEIVAPLLAPCFRNDIETGITPHEHNGSGTPNADAFSNGQKSLRPRCLSISPADMNTDSTPATKKPNKRYGLISASVFQKPFINNCKNWPITASRYNY